MNTVSSRILALLIFFVIGQAKADVESAYCARFDSASATLEVPCLSYRGLPYAATLKVQSTSPFRFSIASVRTASMPLALGQCAAYNEETGSLGLPCVRMGEGRIWARLRQGEGGMLLDGYGGSRPDACSSLSNPPAGVQVRVSALGEVSGGVATASVTNNSTQRQCICASPCTFLQNSSAAQQSLTTSNSASVCLEPGQTGQLALTGYCANAEKSTPVAQTALTATGEARADLCALMQAIERNSGSDPRTLYSAQFAVWALTDAQNPIAGTLNTIKSLFRDAGLDPAAYPGLSAEQPLPPGIPGIE